MSERLCRSRKRYMGGKGVKYYPYTLSVRSSGDHKNDRQERRVAWAVEAGDATSSEGRELKAGEAKVMRP